MMMLAAVAYGVGFGVCWCFSTMKLRTRLGDGECAVVATIASMFWPVSLLAWAASVVIDGTKETDRD